MAGTKLKVYLFAKGKTPQQINKAIPELFPALKKLKAMSSKINEGRGNEENTVSAAYHYCRHDDGGECDPRVEI